MAGVAQLGLGTFGEVAGTALDIVGVLGAPESFGASLVLTGFGISLNVASATVIANGTASIGAGALTIYHAMSMSHDPNNSGGGTSTPSGGGSEPGTTTPEQTPEQTPESTTTPEESATPNSELEPHLRESFRAGQGEARFTGIQERQHRLRSSTRPSIREGSGSEWEGAHGGRPRSSRIESIRRSENRANYENQPGVQPPRRPRGRR